MVKKTTEQFIFEAKQVHGNRYDYSESVYKGNKKHIKIICYKHGPFMQMPIKHLKGQNCPLCSNEKTHYNQLDTNGFFIKAREIHGNKYDYSLAIYKGRRKKIEIICPIHGSFWQLAMVHIKGCGCPKCSNREISKKQSMNQENFLEKCKKVHKNFYNYDKTRYTSSFNRIIITCPKHGDFSQIARNHLNGQGCPKCNKSKGEFKISAILELLHIEYCQQKTFKDLVDKGPLSYDFYIPKFNCLIEYNGEQHYMPIQHFGGKYKFSKQLKHDNQKIEYAKSNGYNLIIISYQDYDNIEQILRSRLLV